MLLTPHSHKMTPSIYIFDGSNEIHASFQFIRHIHKPTIQFTFYAKRIQILHKRFFMSEIKKCIFFYIFNIKLKCMPYT